MAQDMTAEPVARIMIPIRVPYSHGTLTSADGRVMGGEGLGFPPADKIFIGGIFCLQFDRGEAKGHVAPHRRLYCSPVVVDNFKA